MIEGNVGWVFVESKHVSDLDANDDEHGYSVVSQSHYN
jgi:hypothetical protein